MNTRRKLTKAERMIVYKKTKGHCAYCGCKIEYKDMQVDHVIPINGYSKQGPDTLDNMLPACRSCNCYKRSYSLENFRKALEDTPNVLMRNSATYRDAVRYGLVKPNPKKIVFYFEMMEVE